MEQTKTAGISEDWLALWLGLTIFVLSFGVFVSPGLNILGMTVKTNVWTDVSKALDPVSSQYVAVSGEITKIEGSKLTLKKADGKETTVSVQATEGLKVGDRYEKSGISGISALFITYFMLLILMGVGAKLLGANILRFIIGFTIAFWLGYLCWLAGHYAHIAATTQQEMQKFGIGWAMKLTGEAGFIIALLVGLLVGNFFPGLAKILSEATRPELYIKTAIVVMGAALGVKAAESLGLASAVMFRGLCAIVEAYLIYWAIVYFIARKYFKFSREWAAPLASGISICGVSAAIATGAAIRARPVVPIMVSSLVVIFAVVELIVLPFMARELLWQEPLVAGAWMGLAVKTDGAAVASGAVTEALVRAQAMAMTGTNYKEGWMIMTATTVKMFIDMFIGVWAFVLAVIWSARIERKPGEKASAIEIWHRFPKFVIGYALTFFILLAVCWPASKSITSLNEQIAPITKQIGEAEKQLPTITDKKKAAELQSQIDSNKAKLADLNKQLAGPKATISAAKASTDGSNIPRVMFFVLAFFTIGVVSNFKKLWEEGIGKLAAVYVIALFGFIIWIGLAISWIFFHGVKPPLAG